MPFLQPFSVVVAVDGRRMVREASGDPDASTDDGCTAGGGRKCQGRARSSSPRRHAQPKVFDGKLLPEMTPEDLGLRERVAETLASLVAKGELRWCDVVAGSVNHQNLAMGCSPAIPSLWR